jgi:hypothetical protein
MTKPLQQELGQDEGARALNTVVWPIYWIQWRFCNLFGQLMTSMQRKVESIQHCWRKAGLLTATEEADLENDIGRQTVPSKAKVISIDECDELCSLFSALQTKTSSSKESPPALKGSIMEEQACTKDELADICHTWVDIEDN